MTRDELRRQLESVLCGIGPTEFIEDLLDAISCLRGINSEDEAKTAFDQYSGLLNDADDWITGMQSDVRSFSEDVKYVRDKYGSNLSDIQESILSDLLCELTNVNFRFGVVRKSFESEFCERCGCYAHHRSDCSRE